ncbi:MAG: beta-propeller fold lactonase family protein [Polyangiaceae bacterium]
MAALRSVLLIAFALGGCSLLRQTDEYNAGGGAPGTGAGGTSGSGAADGGLTDAAVDVQHDAGSDGASDATTSAGATYVFVGSDAPKPNNLERYRLDPATGKLTFLGGTNANGPAKFMARHPTLPFVYVAGASSAFAVNPSTGDLTPTGNKGTSDAPTYIEVVPSGSYLLAAYWGLSLAEIVAINPNGTLGNVTGSASPGVHCHATAADRSERFVFVANVDSNSISQFVLESDSGTLKANSPASIAAPNGPRHLVFHPSLDVAYVMNLTKASTTTYAFDAKLGTLTETSTVSSLPPGTTEPSEGADIHLHPSGKFLYGSNYSGAQSSLVIYAVNATTGALSVLGHESTRGVDPRNFHIDPSGRVLVVINRLSDNLVSFLIDPATGKLSFVEEHQVVASPYFVDAYTFSAE